MAAKKEQRRDPKKFADKIAARFARNAKKYGVPTTVPSERLARISKICSTAKNNARCMSRMKRNALRMMMYQFRASLRTCRRRIKCVQARIKA